MDPASITSAVKTENTRLQRSHGKARLSFSLFGATNRLTDLYQEGCCKVRFPATVAGTPAEAVLINTAGGLTDGDCISLGVTWHSKSRAIVCGQAAERIYRSRGEPARIHTCLTVEAGSNACWLPQETILFDGGSFERNTRIELKGNGRLFAVESIVFGRSASREILKDGAILDRWRIYRDDRLVFADTLQLGSLMKGHLGQQLAQRALLNGASAVATLIVADPQADVCLKAIRRVIEEGGYFGGVTDMTQLLVIRLLAPDGLSLRRCVTALFCAVQQEFDERNPGSGFDLPRVWTC